MLSETLRWRVNMADETNVAHGHTGATIYTHDLAGNFTSLNEEGEQVTGYSAGSVIGMNIRDIVVPDQLEMARAMIARKAFEDTTVTEYDLDIIGRGGQVIPLRLETRIVYRDGRAFAVEGIANVRR
jgi:PAS domain S-box-containing protein